MPILISTIPSYFPRDFKEMEWGARDQFRPPAKMSALPSLRVPAARVVGNNKPPLG